MDYRSFFRLYRKSLKKLLGKNFLVSGYNVSKKNMELAAKRNKKY